MAAGTQAPALTVVLGHQGGWDEVLMVLVPIALFTILLIVANRKARRDDEAERGDAGTR